MTNFDKLKQLSIDEFAEIFSDERCECCVFRYERCMKLSCEEGIKYWLESEAKDD